MTGQETLERLWQNLASLGARRLGVLAVVGSAVFATVALGSYYLSRPEFVALYTGLEPQDVSRIGMALGESGIAFDVNAEGTTVLVPVSQTARARMLLAEKGLPRGTNAGYELFDKLGSMGLTSFMQEITRVRALEGEIARSIQSMKGVKAARLHIVLPDQGSFRRRSQPPSASVVIRTDGARFTAAEAIRHLVAAAVPGLAIEHVNVLSTDGTVLAAGGNSISAVPTKLIELERLLADELQGNIRKTLAPYLGVDNFEVAVTPRLNIDQRQSKETAFDPESKVERSVRTIKETGSAQNANASSAVGVEQNLPEEEDGAQTPGQSKRTNERREELRNFELNSTTVSTVARGYKIDYLTIAVVINRKRLLEAIGTGAAPGALGRQLKELERLVGSAAGINLKRGDRITLSAVDFISGDRSLAPVPAPGIVEQLAGQAGAFVKAATIIAVAFALIWFGLRPATRALLPPPAVAEADELEAGEAPAQLTDESDERGAASIAQEPSSAFLSDLTSAMQDSPQMRLEQLVNFDEEKAAAILRQWIREAQTT